MKPGRGRSSAPWVLITFFALLLVASARQEQDWDDHSGDESDDEHNPPEPQRYSGSVNDKCTRTKRGCLRPHKRFRKGWFKKMLKHVAKKARNIGNKFAKNLDATEPIQELRRAAANNHVHEVLTTELLETLPVTRLKQLLSEAGASIRGMVEKSELVAKLCEVSPGCEASKQEAKERATRDKQLAVVSQILSKLHTKVKRIESRIDTETTAFSAALAELTRSLEVQKDSTDHDRILISQLAHTSEISSASVAAHFLGGSQIGLLLLGLLLLANYFIWRCIYGILSSYFQIGVVVCSRVRRAVNNRPPAQAQPDAPEPPPAEPPPAARFGNHIAETPQEQPVGHSPDLSLLASMGFSDKSQNQQALHDAAGDVAAAALVLASSENSKSKSLELEQEALCQPPAYEHSTGPDVDEHSTGPADVDGWPTSTMQELEQMGFPDAEANALALEISGGNLTLALKSLIANERQAR